MTYKVSKTDNPAMSPDSPPLRLMLDNVLELRIIASTLNASYWSELK